MQHLSVRAPMQRAIASIWQLQMCDLLKTARTVETSSQFASDCLMMDEPVGVCGANRLFVQAHCLGFATFYSGYLGADQGGSVLKISGTIPFPSSQLVMMSMDLV